MIEITKLAGVAAEVKSTVRPVPAVRGIVVASEANPVVIVIAPSPSKATVSVKS